jgi:thiamine biosynthesis lipoprotein
MNFWRVGCVLLTTYCRPLVALALIFGLAAGCSQGPEYQRLSGATMGTYFTVTCRCDSLLDQARIDAELRSVNVQMSTYDPDSALSAFNAGQTGVWVAVPAAVVEVIETASQLSELSDGAFDVTVGPLVNAWGFGPDLQDEAELPNDQTINSLLKQIGYQQLESRAQPPALRKHTDLYVDLSAIAKGHGVDRVAGLLEASGCADYLVDIGGEVRVRGVNARGVAWTIGVEVPDPGSQGEVQRVLRLTDQSVATSGDYRNFRTIAGAHFSHTIDPRTGRPVDHALASVTVVHKSAMWADGLATAINVLGPERGQRLAQSMGLPVLMIIRSTDGFEERYTAEMKQILVNP